MVENLDPFFHETDPKIRITTKMKKDPQHWSKQNQSLTLAFLVIPLSPYGQGD